jgi:hypothetical protein
MYFSLNTSLKINDKNNEIRDQPMMFAFVSKIMFSISIPQQIFKFEMNIEDNL